jgi:hypothetical protein
MKWLIWSREHEAYWRHASLGYTPSRREAGRFETDEAIRICQEMNYTRKDNEPPDEYMLPADKGECPAWLRPPKPGDKIIGL